MMINTTGIKAATIKREWHIIDLKGKRLGRAATEIAQLLIGKAKPYFVRHLDVGDHVIVVNANEITVSGQKEDKKIYYTYSGYPGGLRKETLRSLKDRKPEEVVRRAVKGMLPQNRLRDRMLRRLHIFAGVEHSYQNKMK